MIINVFHEKTDCYDDAFVSCFPIRMFFWIFLSATASGFTVKKINDTNCFCAGFCLHIFLSVIFILCATEHFRFCCLSFFSLRTRNRIRFILNPFEVYSPVTLL